MTIKVGDRIPDGTLMTMTPDGPKPVSTNELFSGKKVVLFSVPGAFTPGCSKQHLPGFVQHADAIRKRGIDTIACLAVNDAFVMDAWGKDQSVGDKILMLADGNADFVNTLGLELNAARMGMGVRSKRFSMIVNDGVVEELNIDESGGVDVSSAEKTMAQL